MPAYFNFRPYVSASKKRDSALKETEKLRKKGVRVSPVVIEGRAIAKSVWGKAWCVALESHADFENRLPRGRTYARNGYIVHLEAAGNKVVAKVAGSSLYAVEVTFAPVVAAQWESIRQRCSTEISSLVDLLAGRVPAAVMSVVSERNKGLFPGPGQMKFQCSCPDGASMCKHVAAVLYGVGARLDSQPEILFTLRGVDHRELVPKVRDLVGQGIQLSQGTLADDDIGDVFGIDVALTSGGAKSQEGTQAKPIGKPVKFRHGIWPVSRVRTATIQWSAS